MKFTPQEIIYHKILQQINFVLIVSPPHAIDWKCEMCAHDAFKVGKENANDGCWSCKCQNGDNLCGCESCTGKAKRIFGKYSKCEICACNNQILHLI